jgi:dihydrodipicolinate reductase
LLNSELASYSSTCYVAIHLQVFVTGASGKTGALVVQQMLKLPDKFEVAVAVRSDKVNTSLHYALFACTHTP